MICRFIPLAMTNPPPAHTTVDHYEAALEASCDTLITLQLLHASAEEASTPVAEVERHISRAIRSLRHAITELRLAHGERRNMLTMGFVVEAEVADPESVASEITQSKPSRTA
jgi:hypothetical protein